MIPENKQLLIVFVKNSLIGKVKTRLAKSIGDAGALKVYEELVDITENETNRLEGTDIHIYFSDQIIDSKWQGKKKFLQEGEDLGKRMQNAFQNGFDRGYEKIIGIGSDLPDLNADVMNEGLAALTDSETVFGPSDDGGYYLIGMQKMVNNIFEQKPWSTDQLLGVTLSELGRKAISFRLLATLNDIDTIEDLKASSISHKFKEYYELS